VKPDDAMRTTRYAFLTLADYSMIAVTNSRPMTDRDFITETPHYAGFVQAAADWRQPNT
jgi:hypothetical protein